MLASIKTFQIVFKPTSLPITCFFVYKWAMHCTSRTHIPIQQLVQVPISVLLCLVMVLFQQRANYLHDLEIRCVDLQYYHLGGRYQTPLHALSYYLAKIAETPYTYSNTNHS